MGYDAAVRMAFEKIENHNVVSSWTDALSTSFLKKVYQI